jgi:hypothetical protein
LFRRFEYRKDHARNLTRYLSESKVQIQPGLKYWRPVRDIKVWTFDVMSVCADAATASSLSDAFPF